MELLREAATMALYVSVVEIAELTALPRSATSPGGALRGLDPLELVAIIWERPSDWRLRTGSPSGSYRPDSAASI